MAKNTRQRIDDEPINIRRVISPESETVAVKLSRRVEQSKYIGHSSKMVVDAVRACRWLRYVRGRAAAIASMSTKLSYRGEIAVVWIAHCKTKALNSSVCIK